jgi:hypothetical protein
MSIESIDGHGIFRIGSVLRPAWRLFAGDILFFLFVPAVIYGSMVIAFVIFGSVFAFAGWTSGSSGVADLGMVLGRVAALSLTMVGQGVLLLVAFQRLRGQPLRATEVLKTVLSRLLPLLGLSILWSLGLVLPVLGGALVVERLATGLGLGHEVLLLLPAVYTPSAILLVVWAAVAPACVVEGLGPIGSLSRSAQLTKNYRWRIFGIMVLLGLLYLPTAFVNEPGAVSQAFAGLFAFISFLIWITYCNCTVIMTYHDLRAAKEGVDTAPVAAVFD